MIDNKVTYNKDGTPRKKGSGRKAGSNSFVRVTFSELSEYIGKNTPMLVSRVWLENIGISIESPKKSKIKLTDEGESDTVLFKVKKFD
jgi:hypothetical protein